MDIDKPTNRRGFSFGSHPLPLALLLAIACGCSRTVYVPVENVRIQTDTVISASHTDRILVDRDSVLIVNAGDTITREVVKWRIRLKHHTDTIRETRTDTIYIERTVPAASAGASDKKKRGLPGTIAAIAIPLLLLYLLHTGRRQLKP